MKEEKQEEEESCIDELDEMYALARSSTKSPIPDMFTYSRERHWAADWQLKLLGMASAKMIKGLPEPKHVTRSSSGGVSIARAARNGVARDAKSREWPSHAD